AAEDLAPSVHDLLPRVPGPGPIALSAVGAGQALVGDEPRILDGGPEEPLDRLLRLPLGHGQLARPVAIAALGGGAVDSELQGLELAEDPPGRGQVLQPGVERPRALQLLGAQRIRPGHDERRELLPRASRIPPEQEDAREEIPAEPFRSAVAGLLVQSDARVHRLRRALAL